MISNISLASNSGSRRTIRSADGAAWRIKPELRIQARLVQEARMDTHGEMPRITHPTIRERVLRFMHRNYLLGSNPFGREQS